MKELSDIELKKASILDLTDDLELMRAALDDELFTPDIVQYWGADGKRLSLFEYGIYTKNDAFLDRLEKLFEKEIALLYNE